MIDESEFKINCVNCGEGFKISTYTIGHKPKVCSNCSRRDKIQKKWDTRLINKNYKIKKLKDESNLPSFDFDLSKANTQIIDFIESHKKQSIFLASRTSGLGKTRAAIYCAKKYYIQKFKSVRFFMASTLARKIAQYHCNYKDAESDLIDDLCRIDLLIIDDLGKEKISERAANDIFEIIDRRYIENRPIWITSNFSGQDLTDRFDERGEYLKRRIKEEYKVFCI